MSVLTSLLRDANAAQPRIDEATLVAVQHQMAQQAAFAQIPDAVKRVRIIFLTNKERRRRITIPLFLAVYCPLPSSRFGEQPRRDNGRLRQRLEPTHREALCENRMARSGGHRSPRQRRFVSALILHLIVDQYDADQLFLILYRELYYRHVYSRLQPDIDDRFHSYENSCELFNYLLSAFLSLHGSFCLSHS